MTYHVLQTQEELGAAAAKKGAESIREAIDTRGSANILLATGLSQVSMISNLVTSDSVDWSRVIAFHLDEYVGIGDTHPASFKKYLKERFEARLPSGLAAFHYVEGATDKPQEECERLSELISSHPIDVAFVGFGENGHLAFNDPPADFETTKPYIVVELDEACRRQQVGEGWFASVPDDRKADAVHCSLEGPVTNMCPASILQRHPDCHVFLDSKSARHLSTGKGLEKYPWKLVTTTHGRRQDRDFPGRPCAATTGGASGA